MIHPTVRCARRLKKSVSQKTHCVTLHPAIRAQIPAMTPPVMPQIHAHAASRGSNVATDSLIVYGTWKQIRVLLYLVPVTHQNVTSVVDQRVIVSVKVMFVFSIHHQALVQIQVITHTLRVCPQILAFPVFPATTVARGGLIVNGYQATSPALRKVIKTKHLFLGGLIS